MSHPEPDRPATSPQPIASAGPSTGHQRILMGLVIGAAAGVMVNALWGRQNATVDWLLANVTEPIGQLFLRLLLMTVIPLVFSSLIVGVAGLGNVRSLGRVGWRCFAYCLVISAISVAIGLTLANVIKPGKRVSASTALELQQRYSSDATRSPGCNCCNRWW